MKMQQFTKKIVGLGLVLVLCIAAVSCLPKTKPSTIELPRGEVIETRQARIWIYELTNSLAGQIELVANTVIEGDEDPRVRRAALEWKATAVPALQRASFQPDPVVALSDIWLLVVQISDLIESDHGLEIAGSHHQFMVDSLREMEDRIIEFIREQGGDPDAEGSYQLIHDYAKAHPIEGSISTRPSAAPALVERMRSGKIGAFAAMGSLVEGFADLSDRLSIYGEQLPKQARWQAEILLWDKGLETIDVDAMVADLDRLGRAGDQIVQFTDSVPLMLDERVEELIPRVQEMAESLDLAAYEARANTVIAAHLDVALAAITLERVAAIDGVAEQRIKMMEDAERIADDVVDRSFERVETMIDASLSRLMPVALALMAGTFVVGLLAGMVLRRRTAGG